MRHNNTTVWFQNYKPILPAIAQGSSLHCPIWVTYASPPCSGIPAQVPHMKHTPWRRPLDQPYVVGAALPRETAYCSFLVFAGAASMGSPCSNSPHCNFVVFPLELLLWTPSNYVANSLHFSRNLSRTVLTALVLLTPCTAVTNPLAPKLASKRLAQGHAFPPPNAN